MLQPLARSTPIPAVILSLSTQGHSLPGWGQHEPGKVTPEAMAAEANFAKPMGEAQATMEKIAAASARHAPEQAATDAATQPLAIATAAQQAPAPAPARGAKLDLRA
jgi:hypothetical protein